MLWLDLSWKGETALHVIALVNLDTAINTNMYMKYECRNSLSQINLLGHSGILQWVKAYRLQFEVCFQLHLYEGDIFRVCEGE